VTGGADGVPEGGADGCVVTGGADGVPEGVADDAELAASIMARHSRPSLILTEAWEGYSFAGLQIRIKESTDLYGAMLWPSVRHPATLITHNYPD